MFVNEPTKIDRHDKQRETDKIIKVKLGSNNFFINIFVFVLDHNWPINKFL